MSDETAKGLTGTLRDMSEYLGQLATLAAGSIVVMATFAGTGHKSGGGLYAVGAVGLFAYCILATVLARIGLIVLSTMEPPERGGTETFIAWSVTTGLIAFAAGVIALATYAAHRI
jgi:hypothetical protein